MKVWVKRVKIPPGNTFWVALGISPSEASWASGSPAQRALGPRAELKPSAVPCFRSSLPSGGSPRLMAAVALWELGGWWEMVTIQGLSLGQSGPMQAGRGSLKAALASLPPPSDGQNPFLSSRLASLKCPREPGAGPQHLHAPVPSAVGPLPSCHPQARALADIQLYLP
ncbi:uroplakin-3b-like [Platysternon megacephalum]|uniref:Uroplakin-3b-like n=1 Tax=Platysternon megacephalum TaxID=55544 RepID=A0A4D9DQD5_9SAUR|nr:uroplakin-3b-like [Platysternon megacephalum]